MQMAKIRGQIFLTICLTIWITGCSRPTPIPGYGVSRIGAIVTVFVTLRDVSEIVEVKLDNNTLKLHIDAGEHIEERVIPLQINNINVGKQPERPLPVTAPYETLEIQGTSRINKYGVVHLKINVPDPKMKSKMPQGPLFSSVFEPSIGWKINNTSKKPNTFANSDAFRLGGRIVAYCLSQGNDVDKHKVPRTTYREVKIDEDESKNRVLTIEIFDATDSHKVKMIRSLKFLLKDLEHHETVKIKEITDLGEEIFITDLEVIPKKERID